MPSPDMPSQIDLEAAFRKRVRESFDADVRNMHTNQDKADELISIQSSAFYDIKDAVRRPAADSEAVMAKLNLLWYMFIETAKHFDKDDPFQEKLLSLLIWTKEFDTLHRSLHLAAPAAMPDWDSYGFADSLQASWEQSLTTDTVSQQCNLAAFSARALAVGVGRDMLGLTAGWYLREALETEDEARNAALLPAAVVWVDCCRHKLMALAILNRSCEEQAQSHLLEPGLLARKAGIDQPSFSLDRWLFWRRRFQELSHSPDLVVAKEAKQGFMNMVFCGRDLDYDVPGEARFTERLQNAMGAALRESGKENLSGDEIDIDVDWVD